MSRRDAAEMIVRERIAELAGGRVLTEDEEVAVLVAGSSLYDAIQESDREAFAAALVSLVEAWPKSLMLAAQETAPEAGGGET